ncbi:TolC family protein, partial [Frateuria defendens]|uniref:TolC family protein n=1 Tax=Frateuria defendens TaxID=2219559 RepID=UPI0013791C9F
VQLGDAAARDLVAADAALAQAQAAVAQAEAGQATARLALTSLFPDLPLPEQARVPAEPPSLAGRDEDWVQLILARSHEIGAADALARQKDAEARRARADRVPDPSVGVRVLNDRGGRESAFGLIVMMPIGGSYRRAQAEATSADALGAGAALAMVRRDVQQDARRVVAMARALREVWQRQHEASAAAESSAAKAERAYALGETALAELLAARRTAQEAALAERRASVDAIEAAARVEVDAHERWHRHDTDEEAAAATAPAAIRLPDLGS